LAPENQKLEAYCQLWSNKGDRANPHLISRRIIAGIRSLQLS
jgi:hypothetical protein